MTYQIRIGKDVAKFLKTCDSRILKSFYDKAMILAANPVTAKNSIDVAPMIGLKNVYRLRI